MKSISRGGLVVVAAAIGGMFLSVLSSPADAGRKILRISANVDASSTLPGKKDRYAAKRAFDGSSRTAWCEGKKGDGVGEQLTLILHESVTLTKVEVAMGFWKSSKLFKANNRIAQLKVLVADGGPAVTLGNKGKRKKARAKLSGEGRIISFKIEKVIPGKMKDTCITEIKLWGKDSRGRSVLIKPTISKDGR